MPVSSTSVKGFKLRNSLIGVNGNPTLQEFILEDSATFTIGDAVRIDTNGLLKRTAANEVPLGILQGIIDQNGMNVFETSRVPVTSIAGATLTGSDTLATSSSNSTDGTRKLRGQVILDPAGNNLYQNVASATGLAQTNILQYYKILTSNPGQIDAASNSDTVGQFQLVSLDPDGDGDTSKGLFRIAENQFGTSAINAIVA